MKIMRVLSEKRYYAICYFNEMLFKAENKTVYCSSDIIESCFGKHKELIKNNKSVGISDLCLCIAAMMGNNDLNDTKMAMESKKNKNIMEWRTKNISVTLFAQKRANEKMRGNLFSLNDTLFTLMPPIATRVQAAVADLPDAIMVHIKEAVRKIRGGRAKKIKVNEAATTPLTAARQARDLLLFAPKTSMIDTALAAKQYVKAAFGARSPEFKEINHISFRNRKI